MDHIPSHIFVNNLGQDVVMALLGSVGSQVENGPSNCVTLKHQHGLKLQPIWGFSTALMATGISDINTDPCCSWARNLDMVPATAWPL